MPKTAQTPVTVLNTLLSDYGLNPFALSKAIGLSNAAVRLIVLGKSKITVSAALRLSKFFGTPPAYWLDLQREADLTEAAKDKKLQSALKNIKKAVKHSGISKPPAKTRKTKGQARKGKITAKAGRKAVTRKKK
jgi:addiction module HigA family antidote